MKFDKITLFSYVYFIIYSGLILLFQHFKQTSLNEIILRGPIKQQALLCLFIIPLTPHPKPLPNLNPTKANLLNIASLTLKTINIINPNLTNIIINFIIS